MAALELSRLTIWNHLYGGAVGLTEPPGKAPPQQEALNLEVPTRSSEGAHTPKVPLQASNPVPTSPRSNIFTVSALHPSLHVCSVEKKYRFSLSG